MDLSCISNILNLELPTLLRENIKNEIFKVKLLKLSKTQWEGYYKFSISLPKPYNDKLKYYDIIVSNCVTEFYREFLLNFNNSESIEHRKFLVDKYLDREVIQKIKDTAKVITEKDLHWSNHSNASFQNQREEIFILNSIKYNLIWLYLEIKEIAINIVPKDYQDLELLHAEHFFEYITNCSFITEN